LSEGWPDFWIRGKKIDLIDLINTVNLIKKIEEIETITNISTIDRVNTVGTIEKINPTETENVVIDRIAKIDEVTNLGTLDTLNTIGTIQKINPQDTDNVVIDRLKLINTIETVNTLETLNTINTVDTINTINKIKRILFIGDMPLGLIRNGGFESGTVEPWFPGGNVNITTDALIGDYAVSLAPGAALGQYIKPVPCHKFYIIFAAKSTVSDDTVTVKIFCTDGTELTRSETLGTGWNIYAKEYATDKVVYAVQFEAPSANSGNVIIDSVDAASYPQVQVYQAEKDRTINREGVYTSFSVSATGSGSTTIYTPSSGKKAKVIAWNFYCDSDVVCELRFSTSGNVIAGLPAKGATAMNLVGCTAPTGDTDETVEIYVSDAANVKGWICVTEV